MLAYLRRVLPYVRPYWRLGVCSVWLTIGTALSGLLAPWPLKVLVDNVIGQAPLPAARQPPRAALFVSTPPKPVLTRSRPGAGTAMAGRRGVREGQAVGLLASRGKALAVVLVLALLPGACSRMPACVTWRGCV